MAKIIISSSPLSLFFPTEKKTLMMSLMQGRMYSTGENGRPTYFVDKEGGGEDGEDGWMNGMPDQGVNSEEG